MKMKNLFKKINWVGVIALALTAAAVFSFNSKSVARQDGTIWVRHSDYTWTISNGSESCLAADDACKVRFPDDYTPVNGQANYSSTMANSLETVQSNGFAL